nr:DUF4124 domain-containing protein [Psychromonas ossibalaenae]
MSFLLFTTPVFSEVYKCVDGNSMSFSNVPCDDQQKAKIIVNGVADQTMPAQEKFVVPVYPGWKKGWKKTKNLSLERFSEMEYTPFKPSAGEIHASINKQKLTNLPKSMTVHRFSVSVEDIIESICENAVIHRPDINDQASELVYYGQYACSLRRDTQQGELGYYKIMRGSSSIYMLAVKWSVKPFVIEAGKELPILKDKEIRKRVTRAEKYLRYDVKLCRGDSCT